jgi:hypothetical protein
MPSGKGRAPTQGLQGLNLFAWLPCSARRNESSEDGQSVLPQPTRDAHGGAASAPLVAIALSIGITLRVA